MRYLTGVVGVVELPTHNIQGVLESGNVDEAKKHGEKHRAGNEPQEDERNLYVLVYDTIRFSDQLIGARIEYH